MTFMKKSVKFSRGTRADQHHAPEWEDLIMIKLGLL